MEAISESNKQGSTPEIALEPVRVQAANRKALFKLFRHLMALAAWAYLIIKMFIFDIDVYFVHTIWVDANWVLQYKFFLIVGCLLLLWLTLGTERIAPFLFYVAFYPLIVLCWELPKRVFKNWAAIIVFYPTLTAFFKSFKYRCALGFIGLGAATIILSNLGKIPSALSALVLFVYLLSHYGTRFRLAFAPAQHFGNVIKHLRKITTSEQYSKSFKIPANISVDSEEYRTKHIDRLHTILTFNRCYLWVSKKLKQAKDSHLILKYSILSLGYTFLLTVLVFALIYLGLWRFDETNFTASRKPQFLTFLFFSFDTFVNRGASSIAASGSIAQFATMIELVLAITVGVVLIYLFTTVLYKKYDEELEGIVTELQNQGHQLEEFIANECRLSIPEAMTIVITAKGAAGTILKWIEPD